MRRAPPQSRLATRASLWAVCVALTCILAQLSSVGHWLIADYRVCAEHGGLVDDGEVDTAYSTTPEHPRSIETVGASPQSDEHGHDHCVQLTERRKVTALEVSHRPALASPYVGVSLAEASHNEDPQRDRYCFAPKTSPPTQES